MTRKDFEALIAAPPYNENIERWPEDTKHGWPERYKAYAVQLAWEVLQEAERRASGAPSERVLQALEARKREQRQ
jgi:hypothetical protein